MASYFFLSLPNIILTETALMPSYQKTTVFLVSFILLLSGSISAQQDLTKNYAPLKSSGSLPDILIQSTQSKIDEGLKVERATMSKQDKVEFLEKIHYSIDDLLNSGMVLFGDETTKYVERVASELLKDEPKLRKELQFYVIKSNVTNALSTDQGIIFITLGLLAQIENEAQLAYILAHEISHYQERHIEKAFVKNSEPAKRSERIDAQIERLSNHSKEAELEADKLALKLYHKAGYAKSEINAVFDVLMYSYLPFDEIALPKDYYDSPNLFIPERFFPKSINPIKANDDYDDTKSSHPNIRKRREAIGSEISKLDSWGDKEFKLSKDDFLYIRSLARMEGLRLNILNTDLAEALYRAFLLEREYPENLYLNQCKANAWLSLASFKLTNNISEVNPRYSQVEGELHAMAYFISKLSRIQLAIVALRQIEDINVRFPEDAQIQKIRSKMIRLLAGYDSFKLDDMSKVNFSEAAHLDSMKKVENTSDVDSTETSKPLSKYDRIRNKDVNDPEGAAVLDSSKFYLFALSDLVIDQGFIDEYNTCKEQIKKDEEDVVFLRGLSKREWRQEMATRHEPVSKMILIEPTFIQLYHDEVQMKESEFMEKEIVDLTKQICDRSQIDLVDLTKVSSHLKADDINERSLLIDYIRQMLSYSSAECSPVDYSQILKIRERYGDVPVLFVFGSSRPARDLSDKRTHINLFLIDLSTAEVQIADLNNITSKMSTSVMKAYLLDFIAELNNPKK
jgi:hypothetical protein